MAQTLTELIQDIVKTSTDIDQAVETLKDYFDEKDSHFSRRYLRLLIEKHSGTTTPTPTPSTPPKGRIKMHILIRSTTEQDHTGFEVDGGRETQIDTWRGDLGSFERKIRSQYRNGHKLTIRHAQAQPEARDYLVEGEGTQSGKHAWFGHTVRTTTEAEASAAATSDLRQMQFSGIRIKSISPEG